ncbi:MAG: hypothetical protein LBD54_03410, partial [Puniceicoccales bacterium]|nr:hypothetical protein [Puniceicoccales bacterium]
AWSIRCQDSAQFWRDGPLAKAKCGAPAPRERRREREPPPAAPSHGPSRQNFPPHRHFLVFLWHFSGIFLAFRPPPFRPTQPMGYSGLSVI